MDNPKYPEIVVQLTGKDGNAFAILGRIEVAFQRAGVSHAERRAFRMEVLSGTYDELLQTVMRWVTTT